MENRKTILWVGIGIVFILVCCVTVFSASIFFGYNYLADVIDFENWSFDFENLVSTEVPEVPTEIPQGSEVDLEALFAPMWEAVDLLHNHSVFKPIDNQGLAEGALEGLVTFFSDHEIDLDLVVVPDDAPSPSTLSKKAQTPDNLVDHYMPFWETWQKVGYVDLPENKTYDDVLYSSMHLMVASIGDYMTAFMDPYALTQSTISLEGEYEGIGAWVDTSTGVVTIVAPMEGSPAEEAGLLPGDRIVAVDGHSLDNMEGNSMISMILGPAGTVVVLTIERDGVNEPFDVPVTRAAIVVPSIMSEMLEEQIAYVQITKFGDDTGQDLRESLEILLEDDPVGLIIDLRNNGGGYLYTAVEIASEFLDDGIVLYERYGDEDEEIFYVIPEGLATDIPLVILVNGGSASASEIVAGAVQDYERGYLVGTTTFGKGSVQIVMELSENKGAVRITVAHWLTPDERLIQDVGLEPDFFVDFTQEDADAGLDPQLDKAIEVILGEQ